MAFLIDDSIAISTLYSSNSAGDDWVFVFAVYLLSQFLALFSPARVYSFAKAEETLVPRESWSDSLVYSARHSSRSPDASATLREFRRFRAADLDTLVDSALLWLQPLLATRDVCSTLKVRILQCVLRSRTNRELLYSHSYGQVYTKHKFSS